MDWALFLILYFGTPKETRTQITGGMTWEHCFARALIEIKLRAVKDNYTVVRCERITWRDA